MKTYRSGSDYIFDANTTKKNTLMFENICHKENIDPDLTKSRSTTGIVDWENRLTERYLTELIEKARSFDFTNVDKADFTYRPEYLSSYIYGLPDYWYIILKMNRYQSKFEFKNFPDFILIPDEDIIKQIVNEMELKKWIPSTN